MSFKKLVRKLGTAFTGVASPPPVVSEQERPAEVRQDNSFQKENLKSLAEVGVFKEVEISSSNFSAHEETKEYVEEHYLDAPPGYKEALLDHYARKRKGREDREKSPYYDGPWREDTDFNDDVSKVPDQMQPPKDKPETTVYYKAITPKEKGGQDGKL